MKPVLTMSQVLQQFLADYKVQHRLSPEQSKAIGSICCCRTERLGGRALACNNCQYQYTQYHSCRNRHCPQCQHQASEKWREQRVDEALPVPYFHLVFTLPHELNGWAQCHPEVIYGLLFEAVWSTLKRFGKDPKRLNGQIGMTAVLHTWSQHLGQHIHLHCLVPGGALSADGKQWRSARSNYLFPVKALSRCFRGTMVALLRQAWAKGALHRIQSDRQVDDVLGQLMAKDWVVFGRHTCQHAEAVVGYLSQYTHRIAISEQRLMAIEGDHVRFGWKDYAANGVRKDMLLTGVEFIRRFLMHVLPTGFMRVRHYGFLANCHRKAKLALIRQRLRMTAVVEEIQCLPHSQKPELAMQAACSDCQCPRCENGLLQVRACIKPVRRRQYYTLA